MARPEPDHDATWSRWLHHWTAGASVGVCAAFLVWTTAAVVWTAVIGATCAVVIYALAAPVPEEGRPLPAPRTPGRAAEVAALSGTGAVAAGILGSVSGLLVVAVLVLGCVTSPPVAGRLRRALSSGAAHGSATDARLHETVPASQDPGLVSDALAIARLSDDELCAAWRRSFLALQEAGSCARVSQVVAVRQAYLDEMESRSADGLLAWLRSGARASGGPERFLRTRGDDGHPHAA
jgi:hypothetical protein